MASSSAGAAPLQASAEGGHASALSTQHSVLSTSQVGMLAFLLTEVAFFTTLIMAYIYFLRQTTRSDPGPSQVFELPLVLASSLCLFSSSATVHVADKALREGKRQKFLLWWAATIVLGVLFLCGTAVEWYKLIVVHGLTLGRNMFGTTYFTLVGFHAAHVTIGVTLLLTVLGLALRGRVTEKNPTSAELISWYWHFVDGVWVVVFTLVYLVGR